MVVNCRFAPYDIYIGRPAAGQAWGYGNPFEIGKHGDRDTVIAMFDEWLETGNNFGVAAATEERRQWILQHLHETKGKTLGCFCKPKNSCHGDIIERRSQLL